MSFSNPERRRVVDDELAAQAEEEAVIEFHKYFTFAIADGVLTAAQEKSLLQFGAEHGLTEEKMLSYIEAELADSGAKRAEPVAPAPRAAAKSRRRGSLQSEGGFPAHARSEWIG